MQTGGYPIAQISQLSPSLIAACEYAIKRYDFEVHVLGHAVYEFVRTRQAGAPGEYEPKRVGIYCGDRAQSAHHMPVFFSRRSLRQSEMILNGAKVDGFVQQRLPFQHKRFAAIAQLAGEASLHPHHGVNGHLRGLPVVVGALPATGFPRHPEFGECLARGASGSPKLPTERRR